MVTSMFPVEFSARWQAWEPGEDQRAKHFGWLLIAVNGRVFKWLPMLECPRVLSGQEPSAMDITTVIAQMLSKLAP